MFKQKLLFIFTWFFFIFFSYSFANNYNSTLDYIDSYTFIINSNSYTRFNVLKLSFFSFESNDYETSYIYESDDGLEKLYHDFNSTLSIVQRLSYEFPTSQHLKQFLNTGDMKFNSYLFIDMDVDFFNSKTNLDDFSIHNGIISLGIQGQDLLANNFSTHMFDSRVNINLSFPSL
tara:strand:+ start:9173 stop:9697 length:525 start_codon:yes stop_codon:yes gene_type:complete